MLSKLSKIKCLKPNYTIGIRQYSWYNPLRWLGFKSKALKAKEAKEALAESKIIQDKHTFYEKDRQGRKKVIFRPSLHNVK